LRVSKWSCLRDDDHRMCFKPPITFNQKAGPPIKGRTMGIFTSIVIAGVAVVVAAKVLDKIKERRLRRAIDKFLLDGVDSIS